MAKSASIVITTKNRCDELRRAVQSALEQVGCTEVLVFDDGSTDGTSAMIQREFPTVRLERVEDSLGIVNARNRAIVAASREIVFVIDDDCVFSSPLTVQKTLTDFDGANIGAVAIPHINMYQVPMVVPRVLAALPPFVVAEFAGGASAVRRDLFQALEGYRSAIWRQGEEYDFCTRLLSKGWVTRAGTAVPIKHFESPNRNRASIHHHKVRSHVLYAWWNVPGSYLPVHMAGTIAKTLFDAARNGHLSAGLSGLRAGLLTILKRGGRCAVDRRTYKLLRQLHTKGACPLSEIEQRLVPPTIDLAPVQTTCSDQTPASLRNPPLTTLTTVAVVYHALPHYRAGVFEELLQSRHFRYVFVAGHNNLDPSIPEWSVPDDTVFVEARCHWLRRPWFYQRGLASLALRRDIGAIIYLGTAYSISIWYSAILARLTGKQVLFWTHGWLRTKGRMQEAIKTRFMRLADTLLLYGHRAKRIATEKGLDPENMIVIYNSLNYKKQRAIRDGLRDDDLRSLRVRLFGDSTTPYVICTARITRECGLELLLSAQALLRRENKIVNVLLVGDGPERARLSDLARTESLPAVFFGACYDEPILASLIRAASATVSPGKVGLSAIHSLIYGTPVITNDDMGLQPPEVEAITPGRNGDFFKEGNVEDLAQSMWKWCSRPWPDEELRRTCYEVIEQHYNPASQVEAIEYALALGNGSGRGNRS